MASPSTSPVIVFSIPRTELNRLCKVYGPHLKLDGCVDSQGEPLDGTRLLVAMSGRESSFGRNLKPRFEPAYYIGGYYFRKSAALQSAVTQYDRLASSSFGPLQIMASNAIGFTPIELAGDPEAAMHASVGFFNRNVIEARGARTLAAICDVWNTGNWRDANVPHEYIAEVDKHYTQEVIG